MKMCPECHKLSRDDDFCSHCGAAVYGDDNYTDIADISCGKIHSHEKVSYNEQRYKDRPVINGTAYKGRRSSPEKGKMPVALKLYLGFFIVIFSISILFSIMSVIIPLLSNLFGF